MLALAIVLKTVTLKRRLYLALRNFDLLALTVCESVGLGNYAEALLRAPHLLGTSSGTDMVHRETSASVVAGVLPAFVLADLLQRHLVKLALCGTKG